MCISPKESRLHLRPKYGSHNRGGCVLANNNSRIPNQDLNELMDVISAQFFSDLPKVERAFCLDSISFYC